MATPIRERRKKSHKARQSAPVPAITTRFSTPITTRPTVSTSPANGTSSVRGSLPQIAPATARITNPRPMVSISTANGGSPIIGRRMPRSRAMPNATITMRVTGTPSANGNPARLTTVKATNAPTIISSPWAKLSISVAL